MKKQRLNYFDEFIKAIDYSIKCSNLLLENLQDFKKENMKENIEKMHTLEHEADEAKHEMTNFLLKDFLPPIEREDIINIAHRIDNITDLTEEVLISLDIFNVDYIEKNAIECAELLCKCCNSLRELLSKFNNFKKTDELKYKIIEINKLEEEGDRIYQKNIKNIYANKRDAIYIIIWTTIFNCFEECFDACESVADYIDTVIMKNT